MGLVSMFYCTFYFFNCFMRGKFIIKRMIKKTSWKYDYDNNHELKPIGFLKNGVLQVLSSWENQTVLQCLKHHKKKCFTFNRIILRSKNATTKETCFSLYLEKGKLIIQLFWPLSVTMVAKKNTLSVEFLLVTSWKLKSTSWNSKVRF